jgi:hypothetical protein
LIWRSIFKGLARASGRRARAIYSKISNYKDREFDYLVDNELYHGYTSNMKTAISLPDRLYADAEETAKSLGIPRSQLYAKAIEDFISTHKKDRITEQLNEVYNDSGAFSESAISIVSLESIRELTKNDSW